MAPSDQRDTPVPPAAKPFAPTVGAVIGVEVLVLLGLWLMGRYFSG